MSGQAHEWLEHDVDLKREWETDQRGRVVEYVVILRAKRGEDWHAVRVWDNAHGENEMHRHTRSAGKQPGEIFHHGEFGAAMRAAQAHAKESYASIVESWDR